MAENQESGRRARAGRERDHGDKTVDRPTVADSDAAFSFAHVLRSDGTIEPNRLTAELRISKQELAAAAGLSRDAVSKTARLHAPATQGRLRDMVEIIGRVLPWAGSVPHAFAWYRAQPLPSFGDQTAEDLVKAGRAEAVKAYLSRIAVGGYA
jgi:hypothetical protein